MISRRCNTPPSWTAGGRVHSRHPHSPRRAADARRSPVYPAFQGTRRRDYRNNVPDTLDGRLIRPTVRGRARSRGFQLRDELLRRDQAIGLFDDRSGLTPVELVVV